MKQFLLFAGFNNALVVGGWADFKNDFETQYEAFVAQRKFSCDWWQIVDCRTKEVVATHHTHGW